MWIVMIFGSLHSADVQLFVWKNITPGTGIPSAKQYNTIDVYLYIIYIYMSMVRFIVITL